MLEYTIELLLDNFPSLRELAIAIIPCVCLAGFYLYVAGYTKKYWHWRTGYSRKIFHFLVFITVSVIQINWELKGTIVFGIATSLVVFYAIYKGKGFVGYEAMAREKDEPKQTQYIVMPYLATLLGGILANILFTPIGAAFGYLLTGFGDAVGEPFGTAFGRHKYKVPTFTKVVSYRSLEGSFAVLIASIIALLVGCALLNIDLSMINLGLILSIALGNTFVEAISPHGWDNLTTQIAGAGLAFLLLL